MPAINQAGILKSHLVQPNDVRVLAKVQYIDLSLDLLGHFERLDFALVEDFHRHFGA